MNQPTPRSTLFPYTTLFRSDDKQVFPEILEAVRRKVVADFPEVKLTGYSGAGERSRVELSPKAKESVRSEEHTSELQSRLHLVCRLLLEKKKKMQQGHGERV